MPLYKTINFSPTTQILVWEITETFEDLFDQVVLNDTNMIRLNNMKSELHQRGFLSVRKLLQEAGYNDFDLHYDESGKPHLNPNNRHTEQACTERRRSVEVSITHSFHFSAIIISDQKAGIDIEMQREKIIRIADKFVDYEFHFLEPEKTQEYIRKLTVIWGIKESIFKIRNEKGISFKDHIKVTTFEMNENQGRAWLHFDNIVEDFNIHFEEIKGFTLVYAFEN
jgi:phosphopantetheinyl transferase